MVNKRKSHDRTQDSPMSLILNEADRMGPMRPSRVDEVLDMIIAQADRLMMDIRPTDVTKALDIKSRREELAAKAKIDSKPKSRFVNDE